MADGEVAAPSAPGLLRASTASKVPLRSKYVQLYEALFMVRARLWRAVMAALWPASDAAVPARGRTRPVARRPFGTIFSCSR